ncbi:MAG: hypothetical protein AAFX87_10680 [Bacteroidota bacterium]
MKDFRFVLTAFLCCLILSSQAQIQNIDRGATDNNTGYKLYKEIKPKLRDPNTIGYYIEPDWLIGNVMLNDGSDLSNIPLKYDAVRNQLEIKEDDVVKVIDGRFIFSFEWFKPGPVGKSKFVKTNVYESDESMPEGFLEILVDRDVKLLHHRTMKLFQANSSVSASGSHRSHTVVNIDKYYLLKDSSLQKLEKSKKRNLKYFPEFKDEISSYAWKKGLLFRRQDDLVLIVNYYNDLMSRSSGTINN